MKKFVILQTEHLSLAQPVDNFGSNSVERACSTMLSAPFKYFKVLSGNSKSAKVQYTGPTYQGEFMSMVTDMEFDVIFTAQML